MRHASPVHPRSPASTPLGSWRRRVTQTRAACCRSTRAQYVFGRRRYPARKSLIIGVPSLNPRQGFQFAAVRRALQIARPVTSRLTATQSDGWCRGEILGEQYRQVETAIDNCGRQFGRHNFGNQILRWSHAAWRMCHLFQEKAAELAMRFALHSRDPPVVPAHRPRTATDAAGFLHECACSRSNGRRARTRSSSIKDRFRSERWTPGIVRPCYGASARPPCGSDRAAGCSSMMLTH